ncbi:Trm112 family protein [Thalassoglobus neptunius]|uniref:Trm112 family protein n=1 Tax=Thalassoglobus neptunius TaxID=1938619 RepID=UPI0011B7ECE4
MDHESTSTPDASSSQQCVCPRCGGTLHEIKQKFVCPRCGIVEGCCEGGRQ